MSTDFVVIGLGSNLEHPIQKLRQSLSEIKKINQSTVVRLSSLYESEAQLPPNAAAQWNKKFLNAAVLIQVKDKSPQQLLSELKNIEKKMGRPNSEKWAPRVIDLDILFWENLTLNENDLKIPHPHLLERPFALLPLLQIFPQAKLQSPAWASGWVTAKPFSTHPSKKYFWPEFVGILNLTEDSFSDGGQLSDENKFLKQVESLISAGAEVLDFGAESTRPEASPVDAVSEFKKLHWALSLCEKYRNQIKVSVDSYKPEVIQLCLDQFNIDYINDVTGLQDHRMSALVAKYRKKAFVMHSLTVPPRREEIIPDDKSPAEVLSLWWNQKKEELLKMGIADQQLIFDPGIGFGKSAAQSLYLLQNLKEFSEISNSILIGHSRKSYQTLFSSRQSAKRDLETALVTQQLNLAYVQYLRVHDVESQKLALGSMR